MRRSIEKQASSRAALPGAVAACLVAGFLLAGEAYASGGSKPTRPGTHMLLQAEGGFSTSPYSRMTGSFGCGLLVGMGGRFKGWPLRFYFLLAVDNAVYRHEDTYGPTGEHYNMSAFFLDLGPGLRILLPIVPHFRIYADVIGVGSYQMTVLDRSGTGRMKSSGWIPGAVVAGGAEFRWHRSFATGLRLEGHFYKHLSSRIPGIVGMKERSKGLIFLGITNSLFF